MGSKKLHFCVQSRYAQSRSPEITIDLFGEQKCHDLAALCMYEWPDDWPDMSAGIVVMFENELCLYENLSILCEYSMWVFYSTFIEVDEQVNMLVMAHADLPGRVDVCWTQFDGAGNYLPFAEPYVDVAAACRRRRRRRRRRLRQGYCRLL